MTSHGSLTVGRIAERLKILVEHYLSKYNMNGWKVPGTVNPDGVNVFTALRPVDMN